MDRLTKEQRRKNMQAVKSSGSIIEVTLAKALWNKGYRYRKNNRSVFGTPDITIRKYKLAIFVDSEFWHGKDWEKRKFDHKSNRAFWINKIERNMLRDSKVNNELKKMGWKVLRFWGDEIKKDLNSCLNRIEQTIKILRA